MLCIRFLLVAVAMFFILTAYSAGTPVTADTSPQHVTQSVGPVLLVNGGRSQLDSRNQIGPVKTSTNGSIHLTLINDLHAGSPAGGLSIRARGDTRLSLRAIDWDGPLSPPDSRTTHRILSLSREPGSPMLPHAGRQFIHLRVMDAENRPIQESEVTLDAWWTLNREAPARYSTPSQEVAAVQLTRGTPEFAVPVIEVTEQDGRLVGGPIIISLSHGLTFSEAGAIRVDMGTDDNWTIRGALDDKGRIVIRGRHKTTDHHGKIHGTHLRIHNAVVTGVAELPSHSQVKVTIQLDENTTLEDAQTIAVVRPEE